MLVISKK